MGKQKASRWMGQETRFLLIVMYIVMARKTCIPGLFCMENMTMFLLFVVVITVIYMYYTQLTTNRPSSNPSALSPVVVVSPLISDIAPPSLATVSSNPMTNLSAPPMKQETYGLQSIRTQGMPSNYKQYGILTRDNDELILPLMGRTSSRHKYQYYTMTNDAGNINTKLPVSVKGRSCTSDIGCDEIYNGDVIYVEGYKDTFRATIYENDGFAYNPW